jgi:Large polyvalent protein associated domain 38
MSGLALISAMLSLAFKDDEDYQNISEYMRNTNWVIPLGDGRFMAIPKPFDLAIMSNFAERAIERANGDEKAMQRFLAGAFQTLTPPMEAPLTSTIWQLAFNKDTFTGGEIVPSYMQSMPPEMQYNQYTSQMAKQLSEITGWSAMKIDFFIDGIGASAARDVKTISNQLNPNTGTMDPTDAPILRRFYKDSTRGNVAAQDFWKQASQTNGILRQADRGYKHYIETGNDAGANNFLSGLPTDSQAYAVLMNTQKVDEKRLHPMVRARQISTVISELRREVAGDVGVDDTMFKDGGKIRLSPKMKTDADNLLSDLLTREVRNTMIATEQPGWKGKKMSDVTYTMDIIAAHSPELADELNRRLDKAGVYNDKTVYEGWPELRDRLLQDREFAILTDLTAIAKSTPR